MRLVLTLVIAAMLLFTPGASAAVFSFSSSFESGTEGWTILTYGFSYPGGGGTGPVQIATGGVGNSGYLRTEDQANGYLFFIAPPSWAGDLTGGTLSFWLRSFNPDNYSTGTSPQPVIWISDGTTDLFALRGGTAPGISGTDWTFNSLLLDPGYAWSTNPSSLVAPAPGVAATVLSNVTRIGILADWVTRYAGHPLGCNNQSGDCTDITGLDEVRLYPIPEPGTAGLIGAGLGACLIGLRRCCGQGMRSVRSLR